jgi:4-cresol dehydrogenase (hydroxylating)
MAEAANVEAAIRDWVNVLGSGAVVADESTLGRHARTTEVQGTRPCCILYPRSREEVQALVRVAAQHRVVVYPISRGKNWGYGDACAPTDGAAIVDLSRMNRIIEVNPELAYAVIEPGVTQGQLYTYLKEHNIGLQMDCTGAGLDASLVGNTLDRGFGHTRYGDHFLTTCGMEVVLADGHLIETGFGHYAGAQAARVYRYGLGPSLDGLFCQSNLGIVTKIGLWLMPKPETATFFYVTVERREDLAPLVDRLRPLRMAGILPTAVHIGNDLRMLSARGRYPWAEAAGKTPLPEDVRRRLRAAAQIGAWNAGGALLGTSGHVRASRKAVRRALGGLGTLGFVSDTKLALGEKAVRALNRLGLARGLAEKIDTLKPVYGLLKGVPTNEPVLGAQWRLRRPPMEGTLDPLELGCGLMWLSPVVPMVGSAAMSLMNLVEPVFLRHGFDPLATFTLINERAMIAILNVCFDKADPDETAQAGACYDALFEAVASAGFLPYRVGLRGMPKLRRTPDTFWQVATKIKRALDPQDIIARGRYIAPLEDP